MINPLARRKYTSPMAVTIELPFDAEAARLTRECLDDVDPRRIDIFEKLWRGELPGVDVHQVCYLDDYFEWATTINRLLDRSQAAFQVHKGAEA